VALLAGDTVRTAGDEATPDCTTPSDQVTVHGAVPVSAAWICASPPAQISPPPETTADGRASTVTVTDGALTETQPLASVTVSVYVVVAAGDADGAQLEGFESPAAGAQTHDTPPEPDSGVAAPAQISAEPEATAVGLGLTVTEALPEDVPAQCASDSAETVYVVEPPGDTDRVAGDAATPDWTTPSDQVTVQGAVPVSPAWITVAPPGQIAAEPETVAVGFGSTVTVTVAALFETQPLASVTVSV
jgi:hypothetical protein